MVAKCDRASPRRGQGIRVALGPCRRGLFVTVTAASRNRGRFAPKTGRTIDGNRRNLVTEGRRPACRWPSTTAMSEAVASFSPRFGREQARPTSWSTRRPPPPMVSAGPVSGRSRGPSRICFTVGLRSHTPPAFSTPAPADIRGPGRGADRSHRPLRRGVLSPGPAYGAARRREPTRWPPVWTNGTSPAPTSRPPSIDPGWAGWDTEPRCAAPADAPAAETRLTSAPIPPSSPDGWIARAPVTGHPSLMTLPLHGRTLNRRGNCAFGRPPIFDCSCPPGLLTRDTWALRPGTDASLQDGPSP